MNVLTHSCLRVSEEIVIRTHNTSDDNFGIKNDLTKYLRVVGNILNSISFLNIFLTFSERFPQNCWAAFGCSEINPYASAG